MRPGDSAFVHSVESRLRLRFVKSQKKRINFVVLLNVAVSFTVNTSDEIGLSLLVLDANVVILFDRFL